MASTEERYSDQCDYGFSDEDCGIAGCGQHDLRGGEA
jgi:hypothetical protein